ncbi:hypothetical protein [Acinetobacter sp. CIP 102136]|jgi:TctA family transporter|uniref:hypothetical protein n=1 Tax=Acinetobacter sp. CIP 102136 TaxID=1144665 RepID=UPI0002D0D574|nr:hypothetical protein [Acinetobacter sp. CIP 102136]ENX24514.1 hypothetical protein F893_01115 [Acinetobacter sp. CIP 102136]
MLFNTLLGLNMVCILLYCYLLISQKNKNYYLSILIRFITLGLFGLVIFERYETQNHLIVLLVLWVGFESIEQFYARKKSSSVK